MAYGKIVNGRFEVAPKKIKVNGRIIMSPRSSDYKAAGYLPIDATTTIPDGYKWQGEWVEKDGKIVKKYVLIPQEELDELENIRLVAMTKEESEAYENMEETIQTAQNAATEAQQEAEAARADAAAAVEAKEAAEAALADTADIVAKIEEVFG